MSLDFAMYTDVAACKPAYQSSLSKWSGKLGASGVLQKNDDRQFGFHTGLDERPWWYVDLLCVYPLYSIVIHNRTNGFSENTKTLKVEVSLDGNEWTVIHKGITFFEGGKKGRPFELPLSGFVRARFVRLSLEEKKLFHLYKVEVFVANKDLESAEQEVINFPLTGLKYGKVKLTAAILGTSNSINKGYVEALKRFDIHVVANVSIGSSHSVFIPYRLKILESVDLDVLIIDFHVNEQRALNAGFNFFDMTSEILDQIRAYCFTRSIIPVFRMLPTRWFYKFPAKPTLLEHYAKACFEKGIPYFNAQSAISRLSEVWERKPETFFSDDAHLNIFIARCLGSLLAMRIQELFSRVTERNLTLGKTRSPYSPFSHISLSRSDDEVECVTRSTSIVSESFVRLFAGASLEVDVGMGCEVVGLVINMAQTNGSLLIEGMNTVTKRLDNLYFDPERSLWIVVWGLLTPVHSATGKVRITGLDSGSLNSFEDNDHCRDYKDNMTAHPAVVEIQGLILRHAKAEGDLLLVNGVDLNLGNKMEFSMIAPSIEW